MPKNAEIKIELLKYLLIKVQQKELDLAQAKSFIGLIEANSVEMEDIAIIGMACRFPDAPDKEQFWENLIEGKESIGDFPEKRLEDFKRVEENISVLRKGGYLESIDSFDCEYFNIPPKVALQVDPYHRNMLEILVETLEDAGYSKSSVYGKNIGVFVGNDHTHRLNKSYLPFLSECDFSAITGSWSSILASRLSYILNLQGPAMVIDTGCSSGLVALDTAIKAIQQGDCDTALVSAINLFLDPTSFGDETESKDFVVRPFDDTANGTVWSEGVGGIYIKKLSKALEDGDHIYGVVKGVGINNDGKSNGITAPNAKAQKSLLVNTWKKAGISPESISYIETHGTGTSLGDPIEINGLKNAFLEFSTKKQFCAIGSVKANIGHTVGAAGMASLIKVLLCLQEKKLPPSINFDVPNKFIDFVDSPVYIQDRLSDWSAQDGPLRAGVSGFSLGGTNCHVVLEEAPKEKVKDNARTLHLYPISAYDEELLQQTIKRHLKSLKKHKGYRIEDICYTMQVGREHLNTRVAILCDNVEALLDALETLAENQETLMNHYTDESQFIIVSGDDLEQGRLKDLILNSKLYHRLQMEINNMELSNELISALHTYLAGHNISSCHLYRNCAVRRVSLPAQLFHNVRLWDETQRIRNKTVESVEEEMSIADKVQHILNEESKLYEVELSDEKEKKIIAWVWSDVLGYPKIRMTDDFFALGGDSIASLKIIQMINTAFKLDIPNVLLLEKPVFGAFIDCLKTEYNLNSKMIEEICNGAQEAEPDEYEEEYVLPLTASQKSMYLSSQLSTDSVSYNVTGITMSKEKQDVNKIKNIIRELVKRHESLRATFHMVDGEPVQKINQEVPIEIMIKNLGEADTNDYETIIEEQMKEFVRPFHLDEAPLFRVGYYEFSNGELFTVIDMHHIITDGTSMGNLFHDYATLLNGGQLAKLPLSYKQAVEDFIEKQNGSYMLKKKEYWLNQFADEVPLLYLNTDKARPTVQKFKGAKLYRNIEKDLVSEIKKFAQNANITLYMLLLGNFYQLLSKMSNQEDIVIGTPVMGRPTYEHQNLVGMFVNTLPIRIKAKNTMRQSDFIKCVKSTVLNAFMNQEYPFELMIDELKPERHNGRSPLFDVFFALQNTDIGLEHTDENVINYDNKSTKFDLTLNIREVNNELLMEWEYDTELFLESTIQLFSDRYVQLLKAFLVSMDTTMKDITICDNNELERIHQFSSVSVPEIENVNIVKHFENCVQLNGSKNALVMGSESMTYEELNRKANIVAHNIQMRNIQSGSAVAILFDRSFDMLVSILGVLKAGCYYQPLNIEYPTNRLKIMLEDTQSRMLLTNTKLLEKANELSSDSLNIFDIDCFEKKEGFEENLSVESSIDDIAYIMYTSGTTGNPKGALIRHKSIIRVVKDNGYLEILPTDVLLQLSDYSFDGSVFDIFGALINGATLVLMEKSSLIDTGILAETIKKNKVTVFFITTALFNTLVDYSIESLNSVRKILFGGENASLVHVRKAFDALGKGKLIHVYGPTETTVFATAYPIDSFDEKEGLPIGRPIGNTETYVLDDEYRCKPLGAIGELYISGEGLAVSYLNKPEMTAERFVYPKSFVGKRMYKTGDNVILRNNGLLYYVGRIDKQIKLRGFRIELGEIENWALQDSHVKEAHAGIHTSKNGSKKLCLWIVGDSAEAVDTKALKTMLENVLPTYMVPAFIVQMEALPLNKNGKIDESRLDNPTIIKNDHIVKPETEAQQIIAEAWSTVLGMEIEDIDSNFFSLGGDSIKAIQVVAKLKEYKVSLQVVDIFENQTIRQLGEKIKIEENKEFDEDEVYDDVHMTGVQKNFLSVEGHENILFNQALLITSHEKLSHEAIVEGMKKICKYHDMLRLILTEEKKLKIREYTENDVLYAVKAPENIEGAELDEFIMRAQKKIDIKNGPIVSVVTGLGKLQNQFMIAIHHMTVDVVSWSVILEDLVKCVAKPDAILPPKTIPFAKWTNELSNYISEGGFSSELPYWREVRNSIIDLKQPFEEHEVMRKETVTKEVILEKEMAEQLCLKAKELCEADTMHVILGIVMLGVLRWKNEQKVIVNIEGHGREKINKDYDLSRTVGWFTSNYPIVVEDKGKIEEFIYSIKKTFDNVPNKGAGYSALKYLDSNQSDQDKEVFCQIMPQISFNYLGMQNKQSYNDVKVEYMSGEYTVDDSFKSNWILDIIASQNDSGIVIEIRYPKVWEENQTGEIFLSNIHAAISKINQGLSEPAEGPSLLDLENVTDDIDDILKDIQGIL